MLHLLHRFEPSYRIHTSEHGLSLFQGFGIHEDLLFDRLGFFTVDLKELVKILNLVFRSVQDQGQLLVQFLLFDNRTLVGFHFSVHSIDALQLQSTHERSTVRPNWHLTSDHLPDRFAHRCLSFIASTNADQTAVPVLHELLLFQFERFRFETGFGQRMLDILRLLH